tara:strand:+ start:268 stop:1284 length:1017 start_codon:yes stop_codon:yes gene_type:complete
MNKKEFKLTGIDIIMCKAFTGSEVVFLSYILKRNNESASKGNEIIYDDEIATAIGKTTRTVMRTRKTLELKNIFKIIKVRKGRTFVNTYRFNWKKLEQLGAEGTKAVYIHRDSNTNIPFYVGCGNTETRPNNMKSRSDEWKEYVAINGLPIVEIVADGLSCEQGIKLENETIAKYGIIKEGGILVNCVTYSTGVRSWTEEQKMNLSKTNTGVKKTPHSVESIEKRAHIIKIAKEDIQPIINEITERLLNQEGALIVDEDIAKRYNVTPNTIKNIRNRKGTRYSKYPQTIKLVKIYKDFKAIRYTEEHKIADSEIKIKRRAKKRRLTSEEIREKYNIAS